MKKLYVVANWKANKSEEEARSWIEKFGGEIFENSSIENKEIIICPPFTTLSILRQFIVANNFPVKLGSQDISQFQKGAYTGEVPASILGKDITHSIIGHSERRQSFGENDEILKLKIKNALDANITPIFCVQGKDTFIPEGAAMVAYEPIEAIGTGNPDTPENANAIAAKIKEKNSQVKIVLYGGSVTADNVKSFVDKENIDGVLIGGASLDVQNFISIIDKC